MAQLLRKKVGDGDGIPQHAVEEAELLVAMLDVQEQMRGVLIRGMARRTVRLHCEHLVCEKMAALENHQKCDATTGVIDARRVALVAQVGVVVAAVVEEWRVMVVVSSAVAGSR